MKEKQVTEKQEFVVDEHRYPIYSYHGHFTREVETKRLTMSMTLSIPTENIAPISPWIMQQSEKKDVTIVRHLSKNGIPLKTVFLDFMGAQCTKYVEEYDAVRKEVVLHLTATFENRVTTDDEQRNKISDLLS
ncbi:MAG: hypothetical protein WBG48_04380 [Pricia sp.]